MDYLISNGVARALELERMSKTRYLIIWVDNEKETIEVINSADVGDFHRGLIPSTFLQVKTEEDIQHIKAVYRLSQSAYEALYSVFPCIGED